MDGLSPWLSGLGGAHIAGVFKDEADQFRSAVPFVLGSLDRNEKCVYVLDSSTEEQVVDSLMKVRDFQKHLDAHQITFLSSEETYLKGGRFEIDRMLSFWKAFEGQAIAEGYSAMRATGEMSWYATMRPGVEGLREYEARINDLFPRSRANILCQYNEDSFDSGLLLDVVRAHPKVVIRGELCVNPYFTPTDELLSCMRGVIPKGVYDRATTDILKRARLTAIHGLELRDLRRVSRELAVLGGGVLEDIRSQVSIVDFYAELAMDSVKDETTKGYLEKMTCSCAGIQKRLDFMRSYQLVDHTDFRWWDLRSALGNVGERASASGTELEIKVGSVRIWADGLFERALQALVENMPDIGGRRGKLAVKSSELRGGMLISLEHEGKGLPQELKGRIFECGYRCGRSDGYGLFLANEILRSAGMTVQETGVPGRETRFEIVVPQGKYLVDSDATGKKSVQETLV